VEAQLITTDRREQTAGRLSIGGLSFVRTITAYEQGVKDGEAFCERIRDQRRIASSRMLPEN
jgi:hypothetical protein